MQDFGMGGEGESGSEEGSGHGHAEGVYFAGFQNGNAELGNVCGGADLDWED